MEKSANHQVYAPQGNPDFLRALVLCDPEGGVGEALERSYVGSAGWEHAEWEGGFYPEGLPPGWRLAFYNVAFPCVYLAYDEWSGRDLRDLAGWVEDTLDHFRFVLGTSPAGLTAADKARLEVLAPRIGLVLGVDDRSDEWVVSLEGSPDLKKLAHRLQELAARPGPVNLISRDHNLDAMSRVNTLLEIMGL